MVRYFCALHGLAREASYAYLLALVDAGVPVRAMPMGMVDLAHLRSLDRRDAQIVAAAFDLPVSDSFVNVVCCMVSEPFGFTRTIGYQRGAPGKAVDPGLAVAGLHTSGVKNVLIVPALPERPLTVAEIRAIDAYDDVVCFVEGDVKTLYDADVDAIHAHPAELADIMNI